MSKEIKMQRIEVQGKGEEPAFIHVLEGFAARAIGLANVRFCTDDIGRCQILAIYGNDRIAFMHINMTVDKEFIQEQQRWVREPYQAILFQHPINPASRSLFHFTVQDIVDCCHPTIIPLPSEVEAVFISFNQQGKIHWDFHNIQSQGCPPVIYHPHALSLHADHMFNVLLASINGMIKAHQFARKNLDKGVLRPYAEFMKDYGIKPSRLAVLFNKGKFHHYSHLPLHRDAQKVFDRILKRLGSASSLQLSKIMDFFDLYIKEQEPTLSMKHKDLASWATQAALWYFVLIGKPQVLLKYRSCDNKGSIEQLLKKIDRYSNGRILTQEHKLSGNPYSFYGSQQPKVSAKQAVSFVAFCIAIIFIIKEEDTNANKLLGAMLVASIIVANYFITEKLFPSFHPAAAEDNEDKPREELKRS